MTFSLYTHDSWGQVPVGEFASLEETRQAFDALQQDPWYAQDSTVKGIELVQVTPQGEATAGFGSGSEAHPATALAGTT